MGKFKRNKCAEFSSFLILLKQCRKKSDSSLRSLKNFTKDFHVKKKLHGNFYKGFPCKKNISMKILSKMKQRFVLKNVKPTPPLSCTCCLLKKEKKKRARAVF